MFVEVDDATYHVVIEGEGPPVVLLHGFTNTMKTWETTINHLKQDYTVIVIDLPGHGKTVTPDRSISECCTDIAFLLQSLYYSRVHMVGYSMGGRIALSFANRYPSLVASLTLESASPGLRTEKERRERKSKDEKLARRIKEEGIYPFVSFWEDIPLFNSQKALQKEVQLKIQEERLSQKEAGLAMSLRKMGTGSQSSLWDKLHTVHMPVLLLVGAYDHKFVAINKEMKPLLPNASLEIVQDSGHTVHIERPEDFTKSIHQFLGEHKKDLPNNN